MSNYIVHKASILFLLFIIFSSCEYDPTEKYRVYLTIPLDEPSLDVNLNLMTDTINFYWATSIKMNINTGNLKVFSVKFYLDNNEIYFDKDNGLYVSVLNFTQPGIHKFKLSIITNSGTGSMADKLGAEGFQFDSREWTLIARDYNTDRNLTYQLDNNGLNFTWKMYDGIDFKCYRLKETSTRNSFDIQSNTFYNYTYVGESSSYNLYVVDIENKEHLWGKCFLNKSLPVLKRGDVNNEFVLVWNKTIFKDNIAEYQIFQRDRNNNWTKLKSISNNDTSYILNTSNYVFGEEMRFDLRCIPKQYSRIDNTSLFSSHLDTKVAVLGPTFDDEVGINCSGFYFDRFSEELGKRFLYKYTIENDKISPVIEYRINGCEFSPNAKYLLTHNLGVIIWDLYDLNTNTIVKSINPENVTGGTAITGPKISNNGITVFHSAGILYIYDILHEKLIAKKNLYTNMLWLNISSNGKYFSVEKSDSLKIYRINESSVSFLSGLKKPAGEFYYSQECNFIPGQEDYLFFYEPPVMYIRSSQNLSVIRSMNIGNSFFNIDFCTNKILTALDIHTWKIYDFNTGSLLQTIRTEIGIGASNYTVLTNNIIFTSGYKCFLGN